jgi:Leu/Phe-tRNA-protein transferase
MKTISLVHIEKATEYYQNDTLITPSLHQKMMWEMHGLPAEVKRIDQVFETVIDEITCFTKDEAQYKINQNFEQGVYDYLPPMGWNHSIELR